MYGTGLPESHHKRAVLVETGCLLCSRRLARKRTSRTATTPTRAHLDDFVRSYAPGRPRDERVETDLPKSFNYDELIAQERVDFDITWLRDESLEDLDNLPAPEIVAREIVEDLTAALQEFAAVAAALEAARTASDGGVEEEYQLDARPIDTRPFSTTTIPTCRVREWRACYAGESD